MNKLKILSIEYVIGLVLRLELKRTQRITRI